MKRFVPGLLFLLVSLLPRLVMAQRLPVLRVLNWGEYIDTDEQAAESEPLSLRSPTLRAFAERFKCVVEYDEYDTESAMLNKLENVKSYYDVLITSLENVAPLAVAGHLAPIPDSEVPNLRDVPKLFSQPLGAQPQRFSVPYLVGTTGLVYRKDAFDRPVSSWEDYFHPPAALQGRLGCLDTPLMICMALKYLGHDIHTRDVGAIKEAARLFYTLRKEGYLRTISSHASDLRQGLLSGELAMAVIYSGNALSAMAEQPGTFSYLVPREGAEFFMDVLCLLRSAQNPLALQFINFMLEPEIQAANARYLLYAPPNARATELLCARHPEFFRENIIMSTPETMKQLDIFVDLHDTELRHWWRKILALPHPDVQP